MTTLADLYTEFNTTDFDELVCQVANLINWYDEMLFDDPWNTWAQSARTSWGQVLNRLIKINKVFVNGVDGDIDAYRIKIR